MEMLLFDLRKFARFSTRNNLACNTDVKPTLRLKGQLSIPKRSGATRKNRPTLNASGEDIDRRVEIGKIGPGIILYGRTTNKLQR